MVIINAIVATVFDHIAKAISIMSFVFVFLTPSLLLYYNTQCVYSQVFFSKFFNCFYYYLEINLLQSYCSQLQ
nr:MAG TPA: hypothetical protein [Caudoviricetes sp.]